MSFADWIERTAVPWFTSLGLLKRTITLEVLGRKSGKPRRVTVAIVSNGGFFMKRNILSKYLNQYG